MSEKATLKRQNIDDEPQSPKKQKTSLLEEEGEDRLVWIEEQLNALRNRSEQV